MTSSSPPSMANRRRELVHRHVGPALDEAAQLRGRAAGSTRVLAVAAGRAGRWRLRPLAWAGWRRRRPAPCRRVRAVRAAPAVAAVRSGAALGVAGGARRDRRRCAAGAASVGAHGRGGGHRPRRARSARRRIDGEPASARARRGATSGARRGGRGLAARAAGATARRDLASPPWSRSGVVRRAPRTRGAVVAALVMVRAAVAPAHEPVRPGSASRPGRRGDGAARWVAGHRYSDLGGPIGPIRRPMIPQARIETRPRRRVRCQPSTT